MIIDEYLENAMKEKSTEIEFEKCNIDIDVDKMQMVMINEAMPNNMEHYFYSTNQAAEYALSTVAIFQKAGVDIKHVSEILDKGIYITSAVKCPKKESVIPTNIVKEYSFLLEEELKLFKNLKVIMLMGDVAKKSVNMITKRNAKKNVIPSMSTYKIRKEKFFYKDIQVIPSYIMTGPNLLIEKYKVNMIVEDVQKGLRVLEII